MDRVKKKKNIVIWIILLLAILIRVFFIVETKIDEYQFDSGLGNINSEEDYDKLYTEYTKEPHHTRHINYIMRFYNNEGFPEKIAGQFYHPPLHHFIMGMWLKLMDNLFKLSSTKIESMQVLPLIYSIISIISLKKILDELEVKEENQIIALMIIGFFPLFIYLSGFINNDPLVTMFCILSILYLIKWNKNPSIKNTVFLSLFLGLGLMTKTITVLLIIPSIYIYFKNLNQYVKEDKKVIVLIIELLLYTIIVGVLGGWFQIYNLCNGKNTIGIIMPYEYLSLREISLWERFGISNLLRPNNYNIWNYLFNSSYNLGFINAQLLIQNIATLFSVVCVFISLYYCIMEKNIILIITYIIWWIGYFYLNISMPYLCSMHPRYMAVPFYINALFISNGYEKEKNAKLKKVLMLFIYIYTIINIFYVVKFAM